MNLNHCSICLLSEKITIYITECDNENVSWIRKLENILPELEWNEFYRICKNCQNELDNVYNFKQMCIVLESERKKLNLSKDKIEDSLPSSDNENFESLPPELFICFYCEQNFVNKDILAEHIQSTHNITSNKKHECKMCGKFYTTNKALNKHSISCDGVRRHALNGQSKFKCANCSNFYTTEKILKAHSRNCDQKHKCSLCNNDETTFTNSSLQDHIRDNHKTKLEYYCFLCNKDCLTVENYKVHMLEIHEKKGRKSHRKFTCEYCSEDFHYLKLLIEHCVVVHLKDKKDLKPYSCEECLNRFTTSANLIQHRKYHEGKRSHICTICGKTYITKSDLTTHEYTHFNRRNYKCETCSKAFNTNKNLRTHYLVVHADSSCWKYCCDFCGKRFPMKTGFNQHMMRHTGDKQFTCHICSKLFVSKSEVKKHMKLHSNIRDFKCGHCEKEYKDRRMYQIHLAKVHGIGDAKVPVRVKKFACHMCSSSFYDKQKLSRHLCTHTGLKPFECSECDKKYTDKSYLKHHLKVTHNALYSDMNCV